jgi:polyhydroxyalkanoate synthesis regulator phasin
VLEEGRLVRRKAALTLKQPLSRRQEAEALTQALNALRWQVSDLAGRE